MGTTPDELRGQTEQTRAHLAHTASQLAERVQPSHIARRRTQAAQRRLRTFRDRVMGTAQDSAAQARQTLSGGTDQVGRQTQQLEEQIRSSTQGNPLAAGLIAFGTGLLAGSLFPATAAEERLGRQVREHTEEFTEPVKETARASAQQMKEELREPAQQAAASVKDTAQEAVRTTAEQGRRSGQQAAQEVSGEPRRQT